MALCSGATDREAAAKALLAAYPDQIKGIAGNNVMMADGDELVFDDGRKKSFEEWLNDSDIEDMFAIRYTEPEPDGGAPAYLSDAGRTRNDALFKKMYGSSTAEVRSRLTRVDWFGQQLPFSKVNGAADSLRAVASELARHPELKPYLKSSGTFNWRPVRGSNRMSAHSYGTAIDISIDKSDYWLWRYGPGELREIGYVNRIPRKIVNIFRKHGFIWGGAWYHFDTMHFEFRPELLIYTNLTK